MKNTVLLLVLASVFMMGITAPQISFAQTVDDIPGRGNCGAHTYKIEFDDETSTATYTASPSGTIDRVIVKAGSQNQEDFGCFEYTTDIAEGCYIIQGIGTSTVTVTENLGEGNECKDISHIEFFVTDPVEETTPTPTATPSAEPTPTPTSAPTATPTPGNNNTGGTSDNGNNNSNSGSTPSVEQKRGQVLGASTLANTGNPLVSAGIVLQVVGTLLTGVSLRRYGKNK